MLSFSKLTCYKLTFASVSIINEFKPFLLEKHHTLIFHVASGFFLS